MKRLERKLKEIDKTLNFYKEKKLPISREYENLIKAKKNLERKLKGA